MDKRLTPEERRLFGKVDRRLIKGMNLREIAVDIGIQYDALYARIHRRGYRIESRGRLVEDGAALVDDPGE